MKKSYISSKFIEEAHTEPGVSLRMGYFFLFFSFRHICGYYYYLVHIR